ncbi:hypothetical protein, partial [uncultured Bacteroides sp.]|uniref:hypothetical protein n=3 Tax=uncultured Bacteroides sp. TaxID=162156 RepID=UPI0025951E8E
YVPNFQTDNFNLYIELTLITDFDLLNIEALAQNESEGDNQWYQPETRRCKLELGGGWFESSVERVCVFCVVPYSCTSVACGGVF